MEVERRMRFLVIENSMTQNAISATTFPGHPRCTSIPSCWVSMLRGVRFWASLHLLSDTFGAGKHAPKIITCILYGVMIPYGKCWVNYAQGRTGHFQSLSSEPTIPSALQRIELLCIVDEVLADCNTIMTQNMH